MRLHNLHFPDKTVSVQLNIENGSIQEIHSSGIEEVEDHESINLLGATVYPGLINSHDHLDFNLFPALKSGIYRNYREWGMDIHARYKKEIQEVLNIPREYRVQWGVYKNLINGFTTVVNHGQKLKIENDLIEVYQDSCDLHSTAFEDGWKWKLMNPFRKKRPVVMHIGEGTDEFALEEVVQVTRRNKWNKKLIAVHGVAMQEEHADHFNGLIWCPASNYFLLGDGSL